MGNGDLPNSFRMKNKADRMNRPVQIKRSDLTAYGTALNTIVGLDSIFFGRVNLERKKRLLIFLGLLQYGMNDLVLEILLGCLQPKE